MTDPLRRDPTEFLRVLKKMANKASWQKTLLFGMKGRQVGYKLGLDHYNTILFSQSMWGRALEIIKTIRNMEEDGVQPNGATYYYICNGMANAEHGYQYDMPTNPMLPRLQHWRVALNALEAAEANGFDTTDTMHNSVIISCTIPTMDYWEVGLKVLNKLLEENRKMHPTMVEHLKNCLIRNKRPYEASWLLQKAAEEGVAGFEENNAASPLFRKLHEGQRIKEKMLEARAKMLEEEGARVLLGGQGRSETEADTANANAEPLTSSSLVSSTSSSAAREEATLPSATTAATVKKTTASGMGTAEHYRSLLSREQEAKADRFSALENEVVVGNVGRRIKEESREEARARREYYERLASSTLTKEEEEALASEQAIPDPWTGGQHDSERGSHFRPRVFRQEWYKWHAIANKYRPKTVMRKKQLAPRDSPTGIPGFYRI